jgi:hypothetical protein
MAAEVHYGQFIEAVEEFAFPEHESNSEYSSPRRKVQRIDNNDNVFSLFFQAVEKASFPLIESSGSLVSMGSQSSLRSGFSSENDLDSLDQSGQLYHALQGLLVRQESGTALDAWKEQMEDMGEMPVPDLVKDFMSAYDEFVMNTEQDV